jgi:hypothetical protein
MEIQSDSKKKENRAPASAARPDACNGKDREDGRWKKQAVQVGLPLGGAIISERFTPIKWNI